jgi:hypothetical protein
MQHPLSRTGARASVALAVAGAVVGALALAGPAHAETSAASPTTATTTSPSASASSTGAAATVSPSPAASTTGPSASSTGAAATVSPSPPASTASPTVSATTPPTSPTSSAGLVSGGTSARYGLRAAAALPETSTDPTLVAAGFLQRELAAGGHHLSQSFGGTDYPDYGLTLDAILALDAAGAGQTEAAAATQYVADHVTEYIGPAFGPGELYAGATAKSLLAALAQGVDPAAFGGVDLLSSLESLEAGTGRFSDQSAYGDYSNVIGQSLAVLSLHRAAAGPDAAAVTFLRAQQCTDGGFRLALDGEACASDPDATAFAIQALVGVAGSSDADVQQALDYLASRQQPDGGVGGAGPTAATNANSTGLAGQAFLAGGRSANARAAAGFLTALQYDCAYTATLRGGIAYDGTAFTAQRAAGSAPADQDRRATAQAILALAGTPLTVVTGTGADASAPDLACSSTSSPTSSTRPATNPPTRTSTDNPAGAGSAADPADPANPADPADRADPASPLPGALAFTGSEVSALVLLAVLLLAAGAVALVLARRRGAHA